MPRCCSNPWKTLWTWEAHSHPCTDTSKTVIASCTRSWYTHHHTYTRRLEVKEAEDGTAWSLAYCGPDTSAKLSGLSPGTHYLLRVAASNSAGRGLCSAVAHVTTPLLPPAAPGDVTLAWSGDGRLHAAWGAPASAASRAVVASYEVELTDGRAVGPTAKQLLTVPATPCAVSLPSTRVAGGQWLLRVRAIGAEGAGAGGWSAAVSAAEEAKQERVMPTIVAPVAAPAVTAAEPRCVVVPRRAPSRRSALVSRHVVQWAASWAVCVALCGAGLAVLYAAILAR